MRLSNAMARAMACVRKTPNGKEMRKMRMDGMERVMRDGNGIIKCPI